MSVLYFVNVFAQAVSFFIVFFDAKLKKNFLCSQTSQSFLFLSLEF